MGFTILDAGSHLSILTLPDSILFAAYHIPPEGLSVHLRCTLRVMVFNLVQAATHDFQHGAHLPFYSAKELKELKFWVTRLMAHFTQGWNVDLSPVLLVPLFHAACRSMRASNSTAEYPEYDHEGRLITPMVLPDVETPLVFSPTAGADSPVYSMNRMPMGGPASLADYWTDDYKRVKMPFVARVPVYRGIPVFLYGAHFNVRLQGDQARPRIFRSTHVVILISVGSFLPQSAEDVDVPQADLMRGPNPFVAPPVSSSATLPSLTTPRPSTLDVFRAPPHVFVRRVIRCLPPVPTHNNLWKHFQRLYAEREWVVAQINFIESEEYTIPWPDLPPPPDDSMLEPPPFRSFDRLPPARPALADITPDLSLAEADTIMRENNALTDAYQSSRDEYNTAVFNHIRDRTVFETTEKERQEKEFHRLLLEWQALEAERETEYDRLCRENKTLRQYLAELEAARIETSFRYEQYLSHLEDQKIAREMLLDQAKNLVDLNRVRMSLGDPQPLDPRFLSAMEFLSQWRDAQDGVLRPFPFDNPPPLLAFLPNLSLPPVNPRMPSCPSRLSRPESGLKTKKRKKHPAVDTSAASPSSKKRRLTAEEEMSLVQGRIDRFTNRFAAKREAWNPIVVIARSEPGYLKIGPGCTRYAERKIPCIALTDERVRSCVSCFRVHVKCVEHDDGPAECSGEFVELWNRFLDLLEAVAPIITNRSEFAGEQDQGDLDASDDEGDELPLRKSKGKGRLIRPKSPSPPPPESEDDNGDNNDNNERGAAVAPPPIRLLTIKVPQHPHSPPPYTELPLSPSFHVEEPPYNLAPPFDPSPFHSRPQHLSNPTRLIPRAYADPNTVVHLPLREVLGRVREFPRLPIVEACDEEEAFRRLVARRFWVEYDLWWQTTASNLHPKMLMNPDGPYYGFMDGLAHPGQYREFVPEPHEWSPTELFRTFPVLPRPPLFSTMRALSPRELPPPSSSQAISIPETVSPRPLRPASPSVPPVVVHRTSSPDAADCLRSLSLDPARPSSIRRSISPIEYFDECPLKMEPIPEENADAVLNDVDEVDGSQRGK
ncbi:hypothetical protein C8J57DRAFT_1258487 [Mycena rebaudengoi]|nr:hypothetical protein C8J57DRAFT_1258487 [Mycena rebaudengoi]